MSAKVDVMALPETPSAPVYDRLLKEAVTLSDDASGCGYQGYEFGAYYPDSVCIDGYLWDADSGDSEGLSVGGDLPCPHCNHAEWAKGAIEEIEDEGFQMQRKCPHPEGSRFEHLGDAFMRAWMRGEHAAITAQQGENP